MIVSKRNHPSHRSVARLSPPIRKRQEGYFQKKMYPQAAGGVFSKKNVSASGRRGIFKKKCIRERKEGYKKNIHPPIRKRTVGELLE